MNPIFNRKSIRNFENKKIEKEKIENILKAAMQAPSAGNQQPWEFIIIEAKEKLNELSNISPYAGALKTCGIAIIVLGNKENLRFPQYIDQDLGACCENILLQVVNEGLASVWLGVAPEKDRIQFLANFFKLPKNIYPFAIIPIGYTNEKIKIIERYDKNKVYYENYK
jgi:nitroreductase